MELSGKITPLSLTMFQPLQQIKFLLYWVLMEIGSDEP